MGSTDEKTIQDHENHIRRVLVQLSTAAPDIRRVDDRSQAALQSLTWKLDRMEAGRYVMDNSKPMARGRMY